MHVHDEEGDGSPVTAVDKVQVCSDIGAVIASAEDVHLRVARPATHRMTPGREQE